MRDDKIIIISCYHFLCTILFLCKPGPGNPVPSWARHGPSCPIPPKRNLVLSHPTKKESGPVPSHKIRIQSCPIPWKMNLVLSHPTEKRSGPVSSHQKKIWSCPIPQKKNLVPSWSWPRTGPDQDGKSWSLRSAYMHLTMKFDSVELKNIIIFITISQSIKSFFYWECF